MPKQIKYTEPEGYFPKSVRDKMTDNKKNQASAGNKRENNNQQMNDIIRGVKKKKGER